MYADWDPANRTEAQQILASIMSLVFIDVFTTMYQYLAHLAGITQAQNMITEIGSFYRKKRED